MLMSVVRNLYTLVKRAKLLASQPRVQFEYMCCHRVAATSVNKSELY